MRMTVRPAPAGTGHLHPHHRPWTLSLQSTFLLCYHMWLRVAQVDPPFLQRRHAAVFTRLPTLSAHPANAVAGVELALRDYTTSQSGARDLISTVPEHARPRTRRDSVDHQPRRRLSRGRREEDGSTQCVERLQDRASPRVSRLDHPPPRDEHGLRRNGQSTRVGCHERSPRGLGPCRAGGRAWRGYLSGPSHAATLTWFDTTPRATTTSSRIHTRRRPKTGHAQHSVVRICREC